MERNCQHCKHQSFLAHPTSRCTRKRQARAGQSLSRSHRHKARRGETPLTRSSFSGSLDEADLDELSRPSSILGSVDETQSLEAASAEEEVKETEERGELVFVCIAAALLFGVGVGATMGSTKALEYFAGYLLEQSLSIDNLFVFVLVFSYFKVDTHGQDKVLTYGIASAAILRLIMVLLGAELIDNFQPILLGFAALLLYSSYKLLVRGGGDVDGDLSENNIVKLCRRFLKVTDTYDGDKFFTEQNGVRAATPLLLALAVVEISDVVFAVDSIPAVFGITRDPFIVWTSNMMAILSLRALYGFVSTMMKQLHYLDKAVALVLAWIGSKMIADFAGVHIDTKVSLGVVATLLAGGVGASLAFPVAHNEDTSTK